MTHTGAPWRAVRVTALLAALTLAACGVESPEPAQEAENGAPDRDTGDSGDTAAAGEEPTSEATPPPVLHLVATLEPLADLVARVGGDRVAVRSLVPSGADAHTYQPRPGDIVRLGEADGYVGVGLGLSDGALQLAEQHLPTGAPVLRLGDALDAEDLLLDQGHDADGGHTHGPDTHTHDEEDDEGPGPNPHVWTSLRLAGLLVAGIQEHLSELDPAGSAQYAGNAASYEAELDALDQAIGQAIATVPAGQRTLVTYHDAWAYFARDHGLAFATAIQPGDHTEPSAGEVRDLIDLIRELGVVAVFGSEEFPTPVLEAISEETGAIYRADLADDVLPGAAGEPGGGYLELMRRNAAVIVEGLGGDPSGLDTAA